MKKNMKLAMAALLLPLSLTAIASAQEAPVLIGNYSANIEGAVNPMGEAKPVTTSTWTRSFGFAQPTKDKTLVGNYSANVRMDDIRGR
ncbi:hypothetical protein L598_001900000040 [Mesorhizobium sp. J18]|uniref:hypothetical protein n=1 Tax=Mesorhizobium sp. J18 TaxID=935263 RepID=UPI00119BADA7|nr:hypothetical protein [Mesorhizobium sp. J18]TWG98254.1 hypothetical protein L598_001900000040 [Mesorhizobium sp. J18]